MPYNFPADSFHTKKLCSRLSLEKRSAFLIEIGRFAFLGPPLGNLGQRTTIILGSLESA